MDLEPDGPAGRGLRRYVWLVADALGVGHGCCYIQYESPVQAYIPVDDRLPRLPSSDVAVIWDATQGWAVGVEDQLGPDVVALSHLGGDVLPEPEVVADFVTGFLSGDPITPPEPKHHKENLTKRLAAYASRFRLPITKAYLPHDRTTGHRGA